MRRKGSGRGRVLKSNSKSVCTCSATFYSQWERGVRQSACGAGEAWARGALDGRHVGVPHHRLPRAQARLPPRQRQCAAPSYRRHRRRASHARARARAPATIPTTRRSERRERRGRRGRVRGRAAASHGRARRRSAVRPVCGWYHAGGIVCGSVSGCHILRATKPRLHRAGSHRVPFSVVV